MFILFQRVWASEIEFKKKHLFYTFHVRRADDLMSILFMLHVKNSSYMLYIYMYRRGWELSASSYSVTAV